jgi:hypothetical protein
LKACLGAVALLVGCCAVARAQEPPRPWAIELKAGVLAHDVPDLWSGFELEHGVDINAEVLLGPGLPFLGGAIRPAIGGSVNTAGFTSKGYIDARWQFDWACGVFFATGVGAAIHDGQLTPIDPDRKALGSRVLFHVPVELGYHLDEHNSISVYFEHMSNANTQRYNEGLDDIGVRYGYRF